MSTVRAATLTAMVLVAQQVVAKATRDALFLSNFPVARLPLMMIASAALSVFAVIGMSRAIAAFTPARILPLSLGTSAASLVVGWALLPHAPLAIAVALYLQVAAFGATLISGFWSLVNEAFDPATAKRRIAWIGGGGTFGGLLGGVLAWQLAGAVSLRTMLLLSAAMHLLAAFTLLPIQPLPHRPQGKEAPRGRAGSAYLVSLAMLVTVLATGDAIMDYLLGAYASAAHGRSSGLLSFFALFHALTGVATLAAQTLATRPLLKKLGVTGTVSVLPATMIGASLVPFGPVFLRASTAVVSRSLHRSAYELLFTPIPNERRRRWKTFIDVGFERFGSAFGAGAVLAITAVAPHRVALVATLSVAVLGALALPLVRRLHLGYIDSLEGRLRTGVSEPDDLLATMKSMEIDPEQLAAVAAQLAIAPATTHDDVVETIRMLRSGQPSEIRAFLLREEPLAPVYVAHVIPLLSREDLSDDATSALRRGFDRGMGQLLDALLDPTVPVAIRRRIARTLRTATTQRALDGLANALHDEHFEVRHECGRSIVAIRGRFPALSISRERVLAAVQNEVEVDRGIWEGNARSARARQSLDHVFTLLSFVYGDEALRLASRALSAGDRDLRGTALEYLETVLPDSVRSALWPYLGERRTMA